jgi:hypothetical protein
MKEILNKFNDDEISTLYVEDNLTTKTVFTKNFHDTESMLCSLRRLTVNQPWPWWLVKVFSFKQLDSPYIGHPYGYQYVMERLYPLSFLEKNMLNMSPNVRHLIFPNMQRLLETALAAKYEDLHEGNIMKTKQGQYKCIDIESFPYVGGGGEYY